ncbi:Tex1p KNAG_0F00620 [Huiozyma naganishii CBS 8797]|uniref:Uncharacterized protein n=1 Tax=Huiozyma naganishii (strain ATCC MYA-139 / BCRC 22969 / CBS 8797 / KCTC 17520 / NBRC 10181 / NCYC 3082 / Yp74L-3) TaxID=1071383 RepID=J7S869_HUIN7|nr:hypothetical protein KNAG_0F00620 [Kazachstania naganishii CBS 8797]CCK70731.1 hypothetical protein KNAG_0F00620 [Kazachstania naganishii CBS 8797]
MTVQETSFLKRAVVTAALSNDLSASFIQDTLKKENIENVEDDRFLQVASSSKSRFGASGKSQNQVHLLNFHSSGSYAAYTRADGSLTVWFLGSKGDFHTNETRKKLVPNAAGSDRVVTAISWNPNEPAQFATCSNNNEICFWDADDDVSRIKKLLVGHAKVKVNRVLFSTGGKWILCVARTEFLYILDSLKDYKQVCSYKLPKELDSGDGITSICWSNSNDYFFTGWRSGKIVLFQIDALGQVSLRLNTNGHRNSVTSLKFDPLGRYLISGSSDGTFTIWDASNMVCKRSFNDIGASVVSIDVDHLGKIIAVCSGDDKLRFYDMNTGHLIELVNVNGLKSDIVFKFFPNKSWYIVSTGNDVLTVHQSKAPDELNYWQVARDSEYNAMHSRPERPNHATEFKSSSSRGAARARPGAPHTQGAIGKNKPRESLARPSRFNRDEYRDSEREAGRSRPFRSGRFTR